MTFIRSNHPPNAAKLPLLVAFFDGSTQAFCAVVYAVWMVNADSSRGDAPLPMGCIKDKDFIKGKHKFISNIISAKAQVTPLKISLTVPRSKMSGLVLATRLQYKDAKFFPEKVG